MLGGKKIILGITGSIAAYKSAVLTRLLIQSGAEVRVIMTPSALDFITPLTLSTLSKNPVLHQVSDPKEGTWNNHVELGLWADVMVIAPATAQSLASMAHGLCNNLLQAVYLSARCPIFFAPAMDVDMLHHSSTQQNIRKLKSVGNKIIEPGYGELASGLVGSGRMAEPEFILKELTNHFTKNQTLKGKVALVTAGPTYEAIDPVRYIGNHSSGKMGYAIALELAERGAEVYLISGPTSILCNHPNIQVVHCVSAIEMNEACNKFFPKSDLTIMAAAVADYRPAEVSNKKIKKSDSEFTISLTKTIDIAEGLGKIKQPNQILVGFALETDHELENAKEKMHKKNLDLIVLNSLNQPGAGFGFDTNQVTILDTKGSITGFELKSKQEVAYDIVNFIVETFHV